MATAKVAGVAGSDPTLPIVPIFIGGEQRHLVFDYSAIVQAEKVTGVNLLSNMLSDVSATQLGGILWAALIRENPSLTLPMVEGWITPRNVYGIHQALIVAWFGSIPDPDPKDEQPGGEPAQATPNA